MRLATVRDMTLDASAVAMLDLLRSLGGRPFPSLSPVAAREVYVGLSLLAGEGDEVASVAHREVGGVPAAVVTPHGTAPFPVLVWMHGGGCVVGAADESLAVCRTLAARAGCIVVSLDYRLAPEHKAPAALDDALAATTWLLDHASELGGDRSRVAIGGESAGGQLSASAAQIIGRRLCHQLLVFPSTDRSIEHPSMAENFEGYLLTTPTIRWFYEHYVGGTGVALSDPRISPLLATDDVLARTPAATVITAGYDPLRDEGDAYAARLAGAGVPVGHHQYPGQIHLFFSLGGVIPEAADAHDVAAAALRVSFGSPSSPAC